MEHISPKISIFASAVRPLLWKSYLESLKSTSVPYEVIFSGHNTIEEVEPFLNKYPEFKYIHTGRIKPAQNYAIASRECIGETISWSCDDAEYNGDVMGKTYNYWKSKENEKLILSIQTRESGYKNEKGSLFNMNIHRFFGGNPSTPLMCPLNLMSRKFFNETGGIDMRYVAGQYENQILMDAYTKGAKVEIFGGADCYIDIDHLSKSILCGECTNDDDFRQRPFATGYEKDREILENSWVVRNQHGQPVGISMQQLDEFQPYPTDIPLDKSLSNKGKWD